MRLRICGDDDIGRCAITCQLNVDKKNNGCFDGKWKGKSVNKAGHVRATSIAAAQSRAGRLGLWTN